MCLVLFCDYSGCADGLNYDMRSEKWCPEIKSFAIQALPWLEVMLTPNNNYCNTHNSQKDVQRDNNILEICTDIHLVSKRFDVELLRNSSESCLSCLIVWYLEPFSWSFVFGRKRFNISEEGEQFLIRRFLGWWREIMSGITLLLFSF